MQERLTDLEIRYAHQSRLLDQLSDVLFEQQRALQNLEKRVRELEASQHEEEKPNEKPPHY
jgi:SlyX protein